MPSGMNELFEFANFRLDPHQRVLLRDGTPISLTPKAFELLVVLADRSGRLVEKEELLSTVWPDVAVEEGNLTVMISHLRKALGDDPEHHLFIETVPKHGYRFTARVARRVETDRGPERPTLQAEETHAVPFSQASGSGRRSILWRGSAVGLSICALALVWRFSAFNGAAEAGSGTIRSLAILPFQELGQPQGNAFLGEGTADALITRLGSIDSIVVRPTSAMDKYRNSALSAVEIGRKQEVDAVLDGRIQREGDRIRLTVQLLRVRDGTALWADSFDEKVTNIFALEDEISERVAQSLRLRFSREEVKRIRRKPTDNPDAYEAYLKGRYFWNKRTEESVRRGLDYFREAIRLDPTFAEGYEGIADSYATLGLYGSMSPNEAFPQARMAAQKALSMNKLLAEAHATLGLIHFYYDWDGPAAENEFRLALDINPNYAMAHSWNSEALAAMGRFPEAMAESQRAMEDDPLSLIVNSNAGWTFFLAGRTDKSIQILKKAIELDPAFTRTHFRLGIVYQAGDDSQNAIAEFRKAVALSNGNAYYEASLANAYAAAGFAAEARQVLDSLKTRARNEYVPAFGFALVYSGLKDRDNAFEWLRRATTDHSTSMAFVRVDPLLASLRSDSRFTSLVQELRF
jgi:DNA-binding winged helix-turn-helix (wHTH) protein/TolB-like protein/Tfp pilus assembly protein PilF